MIRKSALAILLATSAPAAANGVDRLEVLNDGASSLAILCNAVVYRPGWAWCALTFERKAHAHWRLSGPRASHVLDREGNPCAVTAVHDMGHKTRRTGWVAFAFAPTTYAGQPCVLPLHAPTHWVADHADDNLVVVDAR